MKNEHRVLRCAPHEPGACASQGSVTKYNFTVRVRDRRYSCSPFRPCPCLCRIYSAQSVIDSLPKSVHSCGAACGYDPMCIFCQDDYVEGDVLRTLPLCGHAFHAACVDEWLKANDTCPYCKQAVVKDEEGEAAAAAGAN